MYFGVGSKYSKMLTLVACFLSLAPLLVARGESVRSVRRRLPSTGLGDVTCSLMKVAVQIDQSHSHEEFVCVDQYLTYRVDLPETVKSQIDLTDATKSTLVISNATIDDGTAKIIASADSHYQFSSTGNRNRMLVQSIGSNRVLVLRVWYLGTQPSLSSSQLSGRIFGIGSDGVVVNLADQLHACSSGKLTLYPPPDDANIYGGVMDVYVQQQLYGSDTVTPLVNLAYGQAAGLLGSLSVYDHIMVVVPTHSDIKYAGGGFIAHSWMNGQQSVFSDTWAGSTSAVIHEIGHNLNLAHAGAGTDPYADTTGYMGYSSADVGTPAECYNAQKLWTLGWFTDRSRSLQVSDLPFRGYLASFVDYSIVSSNWNVLIEIKGTNSLYLEYNRAKGMDSDSRAHQNQVAIVGIQGSDPTAQQSWFKAAIMTNDPSVSDTYRSENFASGSAVVVQVCDKTVGTPDYVRLSIYLDNGIQKSTCSCVDSTKRFYNQLNGTYRTCNWLYRYYNSVGSKLCVPNSPAYTACPVTCHRC